VSAAFKLRPDKPGNWRRQAALGLMAVFAVAVLGARLLPAGGGERFLTREGNKRQVRTVALQANRGAVRDRNGEPLALSAPVDSIWVVPSDLLDAPPYVVAMSKLLGVSSRELKASCASAPTASSSTSAPDRPGRGQALHRAGAPGVFSQREYRRYYPAGEVAAHVVGFCDIDGKARKASRRRRTRRCAHPGSRRVIRDRAGRVIRGHRRLHPGAAGPGRQPDAGPAPAIPGLPRAEERGGNQPGQRVV